MQVRLLTDRQSGFQLGWHERRVEEQRAHGKVAAAAEVGEAGHNGRWVVGGSLSHVIPHRHAHTQRESMAATRATYFISCKCPRKYEHYIPETEAAAFARKRQAGRRRGRGGTGTGRTFATTTASRNCRRAQSSSSGIQR